VKGILKKYKAGQYDIVRDKALRFVTQHYSYDALIKRYFIPAVESYFKDRQNYRRNNVGLMDTKSGHIGMLFNATRSQMLVRSDGHFSTPTIQPVNNISTKVLNDGDDRQCTRSVLLSSKEIEGMYVHKHYWV
jgi:hypothetical protein